MTQKDRHHNKRVSAFNQRYDSKRNNYIKQYVSLDFLT